MSAALASTVASCSLPLFSPSLPSPVHPHHRTPCLSVFIFLSAFSLSLSLSLSLSPSLSLSLSPRSSTRHRLPHRVAPRDSNRHLVPPFNLPFSPHPNSAPFSPSFFPEFESIKNRLEQRNERPPISHRIMSGAPSWPGGRLITAGHLDFC